MRQRKARPKTPHRATPAHRVKPKPRPKPKHSGPVTKYDPAKLPDVVKWLEDGKTQAVIAQRVFGVRPEQLSRWKAQHPQLRQAIESGETRYWESACDNVERVSVASATGRVPRIVKEVRDADGRLTGEKIVEYHPPAVGMAVFLLCNKRPGKWQNVQRVEVRRDREGPRPIVFVVEGQAKRVALDGSAAIVQEGPSGNGHDEPKMLEADKSETSETED